MIQDARVLQSEFVPGDIVRRDAELNAITRALNPITRGESGETTCLFGPTGVGKTCTAKYIFERLRERVIDLNTNYINCWEAPTKFKILHQVLDGVHKTVDIHRQSTPTDVLTDRLHDYDGPPYIVILDEVDQLHDTRTLYDLSRMRELTMILIANREEELFARLDDRVSSRLKTATCIDFDPYSTTALVAILQDRVQWGLEEGAITTSQLETIAETAAGDARVAIGILRGAARQAMQDGGTEITDELIQDTVSHAKAEIKRQTLDRLTEDQRVLFEIVSENGDIAPSDLYDAYQNRVDEPKTNRMVRNYLSKMCQYNLIVANGENRGRTYRTKV
ncbi:Cdc6/Cdc18 family protein [Halorussus sp. AFM4]|uniref:Cdc6/Cdc18 family protein n=1 Tax=Halorussus sp. AFM4 TaxID=3421651 RepID=UPI003EB7EAD0